LSFKGKTNKGKQMSKGSPIEWTDHTFNPWWGCTKVSIGCQNCYAQTLARRFGYKLWGVDVERRLFGDKHWQEPLKWNKQAKESGERARVFCASMADVFEDFPSLDAERNKLWNLIGETPWLNWQLLTKRPENVLSMAPWSQEWPENVWVGVSVEDQTTANRRVPILKAIPAPIRFLSCEPLIGPVDTLDLEGIHWVIAGGESGRGYRLIEEEWVRKLRDNCVQSGVAFFFKQWGGTTSKSKGRTLDNEEWGEFPLP
jgi:protein gp37